MVKLILGVKGTGKTKTLTYRVARLIEDGISPENILLLTFTKKAADEKAKDITKRLINLEEQLAIDIRQYL